jgi:hypothetical protein
MKILYSTKSRLQLSAILIAIAVVFYFYLKFPFYKLFPNYGWMSFVWIGGLFALGSMFGAYANRLRNWNVGIEAEEYVDDIANELPNGFIPLHNLVVGNKGNIDHVIVGPTGIWVIETKSHNGKITFDGRELKRDGRSLEKDFLGQAMAEAYAVKDILKKELQMQFDTQPIIIFAGNDVDVRFGLNKIKGVYVVGPTWLDRLITNNLIQKLDDQTINKVVDVLKKYKE